MMTFQPFITIIILTSTTLVILFSANAVYGSIPPGLQEVAIVKHKEPPPYAPSLNHGNTIIQSPLSSQPSTSSAAPASCINRINHNPSTRTISVSTSELSVPPNWHY
jgi:hypothetical protein